MRLEMSKIVGKNQPFHFFRNTLFRSSCGGREPGTRTRAFLMPVTDCTQLEAAERDLEIICVMLICVVVPCSRCTCWSRSHGMFCPHRRDGLLCTNCLLCLYKKISQNITIYHYISEFYRNVSLHIKCVSRTFITPKSHLRYDMIRRSRYAGT